MPLDDDGGGAMLSSYGELVRSQQQKLQHDAAENWHGHCHCEGVVHVGKKMRVICIQV
jgi:hypothetical protein